MLGVRHSKTSPYHPQTNGQVERAHQTIMRMIGKLVQNKKADWPNHLAEIVQAYNSTRSSITGYSPHFLMFGRRPHLPVDFYFPTQRDLPQPKDMDGYVTKLQIRLKEALREVEAQSAQEAQRQKRHYDRKIGSVDLEPGD